jgi:DNA-binding transcriptional regulator YdaS (Cro superfamily)
VKLRDYLRIMNIKQNIFAERVGMAPATISNYIKGKRKPSAKNALVIERYTSGKVTVEDFVDK